MKSSTNLHTTRVVTELSKPPRLCEKLSPLNSPYHSVPQHARSLTCYLENCVYAMCADDYFGMFLPVKLIGIGYTVLGVYKQYCWGGNNRLGCNVHKLGEYRSQTAYNTFARFQSANTFKPERIHDNHTFSRFPTCIPFPSPLPLVLPVVSSLVQC